MDREYSFRAALKVAGLLVIMMMALSMSGCAFFNRENTPTLNWVEDTLWPNDTTARVAVFPLVFPAGLLAVSVDAFVIHSASVVGDAGSDTGDALWDDMKWDERYMTESALLPWRSITTPIVFTGDFIGRAWFNIPKRIDEEKAETEQKQHEEQAERWIEEGEQLLKDLRPSDALDHFLKTPDYPVPEPVQARMARAVVEAAIRCGRTHELESFRFNRYGALLERYYPGEIAHWLNEMGQSDNPIVRWGIYEFTADFSKNHQQRLEATQKALHDPNPVVRQRMLLFLDVRQRDGICVDSIPEVERIAQKDSEPMNQIVAEQLLRDLRR